MPSDGTAPDQAKALPEAPAQVERPSRTIAGRVPDDDWQVAAPMPMGPATRRALLGIIRALCPRPPAPWSDEIEEKIEQGVRVFLRYMPPVMGWGFGPMLIVLDLSPLWRLRSLQPLHTWEREAAAE